MATKIVKAAGGASNVGSTYEPEGVPTSADDLVLNASSGNFEIAAALSCRSWNLTGYTHEVKHLGFTVTVGNAEEPPEGKLLVFPASGWTYTHSTNSGNIKLACTKASTTVTVDFNNNSMRELIVAGSTTTTFKFLSGVKSTTNICKHEKGTIDWNGQSTEFTGLNSNFSNTREIKFGNGTHTYTGTTSTAWNCTTTTGLTIDFAEGTIKFTGAAPQPTNFFRFKPYNVEFTGVTGSAFDNDSGLEYEVRNNLTMTAGAGKLGVWFPKGKMTIKGTATLKGNSEVNRLLVESSFGANRVNAKLSAATVSLENVDFGSITGEGAATWSGTSVGDSGFNSGITFTESATQTWNGNTTSTWETKANWTSRVPLPQDDVKINGLTSGTITVGMPRVGRNIDLTGSSGGKVKATTSAFRLTGGIKWVSGVTPEFTVSVNHFGSNDMHIDWAEMMSSTTHTAGYQIAANGHDVYLDNDIKLSNVKSFAHFGGTLHFGSHTFEVGFFEVFGTEEEAAGKASVAKSASTITLTGTTGPFVVSPTRFNEVDFSEHTFKFTGAQSSATFALIEVPGTFTVKTIEETNAEAKERFANCKIVANKIVLKAGNAWKFEPEKPVEAKEWVLKGEAGKLISLASTSAGTKWEIKQPSGVVSGDYLKLQDSKAAGGATFYAGTHSENVSGNENWIFTAPPVEGAASIAGSGAISSTGLHIALTGAKIEGSGAITDSGVRIALTNVTVAGSGAMTNAGERVALGKVSIAGTGALSASGLYIAIGKLVIAGTGAITVKGLRTALGEATVAGSGLILARSIYNQSGVLIQGSGAITSKGFKTAFGRLEINSLGQIETEGERIVLSAFVIPGTGAIVGSGADLFTSGVTITGESAVVVGGQSFRIIHFKTGHVVLLVDAPTTYTTTTKIVTKVTVPVVHLEPVELQTEEDLLLRGSTRSPFFTSESPDDITVKVSSGSKSKSLEWR